MVVNGITADWQTLNAQNSIQTDYLVLTKVY